MRCSLKRKEVFATVSKSDKKNKINQQQRRFVQEHIKNGGNATQAAIAAGYSKNTAKQTACRLLTYVYIQEYREKLLQKLEKDSIATVDEILQYLTRVMRREEKESVVASEKKKVSGYVTDPTTGKREKKTVEEEKPVIVEIPSKLSDANKAAELLGKNLGIWIEKQKIEQEGGSGITINISPATEEDARKALEEEDF